MLPIKVMKSQKPQVPKSQSSEVGKFTWLQSGFPWMHNGFSGVSFESLCEEDNYGFAGVLFGS